MSLSPLKFADMLRIGDVEFVSPNEIKVVLDVEAPNSIALNTGVPRPFPRVNSYLVIPNDEGYLVGQVEWITIERFPNPRPSHVQDSGLINLPFPMRKVSLNPLGTLRKEIGSHNEELYRFKRGADIFPTVGDSRDFGINICSFYR